MFGTPQFSPRNVWYPPKNYIFEMFRTPKMILAKCFAPAKSIGQNVSYPLYKYSDLVCSVKNEPPLNRSEISCPSAHFLAKIWMSGALGGHFSISE